MKIDKIRGTEIVRVKSDEIIIKDGQSLLDFVMSIEFETKVNRIIIDKKIIAEGFFDLKTRMLGEAFQKLITYDIKMAIIGDYSIYNSNSFRGYITETNRGNNIFFVLSADEALKKLSK